MDGRYICAKWISFVVLKCNFLWNAKYFFQKKTSYRFLYLLYQLISIIGLMGECDTCDKCYALLLLLLLDSIIFIEDYISLYTYRDDSSWLHRFIYFRFRDYLMHFFYTFFLNLFIFSFKVATKYIIQVKTGVVVWVEVQHQFNILISKRKSKYHYNHVKLMLKKMKIDQNVFAKLCSLIMIWWGCSFALSCDPRMLKILSHSLHSLTVRYHFHFPHL